MSRTKASPIRKPAAVIKKSFFWFASVLSLKKSDVVFACFPKVGSTWVRIVLWHVYDLQIREGKTPLTFDRLDAEMPEMGHPASYSSWPFAQLPRLQKTHKPYLPFYRNLQAVVMVRDPIATMDSLLAFLAGVHHYSYQGTIDELIHDHNLGLEAWFRYYRMWLPKAGLVLKYEELRSNPELYFGRLLDFLGVACSPDILTEALHRSSIEQTRSAQADSSHDYKQRYTGDFQFARSGNIAASPQKLSPKSIALYHSLKKKYELNLYPDTYPSPNLG